MRELKFRVWGLYGDGYSYISEENQAEAESFWDKHCIAILDEKHIVKCGTDEDGEGAGYEYCDVEEVETVEQYTGLKDKNDKEIYEGDIVRWSFKGMNNRLIHTADAVEWKSYAEEEWPYSTISGFTLPDSEDGYEVIGNIHENPELLEGKL